MQIQYSSRCTKGLRIEEFLYDLWCPSVGYGGFANTAKPEKTGIHRNTDGDVGHLPVNPKVGAWPVRIDLIK